MKKIIAVILIVISQSIFAEINVIVPYTAGGAFDSMARRFEKFVIEHSQEKISVINVPGAGGYLGLKKLESLSNSIVLTSNSFYYIVKDKQLSLDEFQYIGILAENPYFIAVSDTSDLTCDKLKNKNKSFFIGTSGPNSSSAIPAEIIINKYKNFVEIPYKGQSQAIIDLIGKHIDIVFVNGNISDRPDLKLLANTTNQSFEGVQGWNKCLGINKNYKGQFILLTSSNSNPEFVNKVKQLSIQFINSPETIDYFKEKGFNANMSNIYDVEKLIRKDYDTFNQK
jgi:tripartite-type tricarboxylate transporter receptor subunit TctC